MPYGCTSGWAIFPMICCVVMPGGWQVADLWRRAAAGVGATHDDWALLYQELLAALGAIVADPPAGDEGILGQLHSLLSAHRARRPVSRASAMPTRSYRLRLPRK